MGMLDFERRGERLASRAHFTRRLARSLIAAAGLTLVALAVGMAGYMAFEGMGAVDGFANAALILSGMGPLDPLKTGGGRVFAGLYALASGVLYIALSALVLAPVFHRVLHRFHVDDDEEQS